VYVAAVLLQTLVLPVASGAAELILRGGDPVLALGRWFLFWGVGTRLLLAGAVQVVRPGFTARDILGDDADADADAGGARHIVQEPGFANLAMGALAASGALVPAWWVPAALPGGAFLGQAGLRHVAARPRAPGSTSPHPPPVSPEPRRASSPARHPPAARTSARQSEDDCSSAPRAPGARRGRRYGPDRCHSVTRRPIRRFPGRRAVVL